MKTNPAFKRTQPLPLLSADYGSRAGRVAQDIARTLPVTGTWPVAVVRATERVGRANFNVPVVGLMA